MKEQKYTRRLNIIRGPGSPQTFHSINAAKRASHAIQMKEDGALGRGTLRNIKIK